MRLKKTISPEKPLQDSIEYRFRLLFWPCLSYAIAITFLGDFVLGIFSILSAPISIAIPSSVCILLITLGLQLLAACVLAKIANLILTPFGISGLNLLCRRTYIDWQEITIIKPYQIMGIRCLSIKTANGVNIQFTTRFHGTAQILDRVRELAGEDHILVRALEKELSRPRYELTKLWIGVIGAIALTMSIYLIGGNMYATAREQPLKQSIASYISQHPKTAPNQSAIELQALIAKLGLSVDVFGDGSEVKVKPTAAAIGEWKSIEVTLSDFVNKQLAKTEDSIEPIPTKLATYLKTHQAELEAIETHLATNSLPEWGTDLWIAQSDPQAENSPLLSKLMNVFSLAHVQNLTIANLLEKQQQPSVDLARNLVAIEKLQLSVRSQQSLVGQLIGVIGKSKISKLVSQIDSPAAILNGRVPQGWGDNLFGSESHKYMREAIEYESINSNKFLQEAALFDRLLVSQEIPLRFIPGFSHLVHPHRLLAAIDRDREVSEGLAYWNKQNICRTDGKTGIKANLDFAPYFIDTTLLTSQYPKVLKQDLFWELTTSVRQVKAKLAAGEKADVVANEFTHGSLIFREGH
jgi:hypothetical protein